MADIQTLVNMTGSTYKLVILAARRAIELREGAARLVDMPADTKVTNVAVEEIAQGKVSFKVKGDK